MEGATEIFGELLARKTVRDGSELVTKASPGAVVAVVTYVVIGAALAVFF